MGVLTGRSPEMVVASLGILKAGAATCRWTRRTRAERLAFMLADAGLRFMTPPDPVEAGAAGAARSVCSD